jgi:hypothetical protein
MVKKETNVDNNGCKRKTIISSITSIQNFFPQSKASRTIVMISINIIIIKTIYNFVITIMKKYTISPLSILHGEIYLSKAERNKTFHQHRSPSCRTQSESCMLFLRIDV